MSCEACLGGALAAVEPEGAAIGILIGAAISFTLMPVDWTIKASYYNIRFSSLNKGDVVTYL